ncbi:MAG: hypothetical protein DSM106950_01345 [Stigonema ocellatum SAG 48.90 = DSM 106950]|nr:hypothetical protein [Stigonema ocellatum SAG 48.90 = DSM 106950]
MNQLTLFNLLEVESVRSNPVHDPYSKVESVRSNPVHDPYWDETEEPPTASLDKSQFSGDTESVVDPSAPPHASVGEQIFSPGAVEDASVGEQIFCPSVADSPYSSVGEQVLTDTKKTAPQHDTQTTHWIEKYWVARGNNKYWYYRYMWMEGRKLRRLYIGSVNSPQARHKVELIKGAIDSDKSPCEVKELIANTTPTLIKSPHY